MSKDLTQNIRTALKIFISSVSTEFGDDRDDLSARLQQFGVIVVQQAYPTSLDKGNSIADAIEAADLIVCLIGHQSGYPFPPRDRPVSAREGCSWTQWEFDYAKEVVERNPNKRLVVFIDKGKPRGSDDPLQTAFRERIDAEKKSYKSVFFYPYIGRAALLNSFELMIKDRIGGLAAIQYSYWLKIREAYRAKTLAEWDEIFPRSYRPKMEEQAKESLMRAGKPPFIESRKFSILNPAKNGEQLKFLQPDAFLTGRDTNNEQNARKDADWQPLSLPDTEDGSQQCDGERIVDVLGMPGQQTAVLGTVQLTTPLRLFLISGSGIGKSASLAWFAARLNGLGEKQVSFRLALLLQAGELLEVADKTELVNFFVRHLLRKSDAPDEDWSANAVRTGLAADIADGRIVLIIDALDHAEQNPPLLIDSQNTGFFDACPAVMAGRPQALNGWKDGRSTGELNYMIAARWRFIEPLEFDSDESNVFLGKIGDITRQSLVEEYLGGLLRVPRVLEYVRKLGPEDLKLVRTMADIYFRAMTPLVEGAMMRPAARRIGPKAHSYEGRPEPHEEQVASMLMMLAALAFTSLCVTFDPCEKFDSHGSDIEDKRGRGESQKADKRCIGRTTDANPTEGRPQGGRGDVVGH